MITSSSSDIGRHMEPVARALLGEPNPRHSSPTELRYGNNGSMSIDVAKGVFFNFEDGEHGGVLDLIARETGYVGAAAVRRLEEIVGGASNRPNTRKTNATPKESIGRIVASYDYRSEDGTLLSQVVRYDPKTFRQRRPVGEGWSSFVKGVVPHVPYRLPELLAAEHETVLVTEGEKDADNLIKLGFVATTNAGGAGKWHPDLNCYFKDKDVYIAPHNDEAGEKHAMMVAQMLRPVARSVKIICLPGLSPKGDVSDWIVAGGTADDLVDLMRAAVPAETLDAPEDRETRNPRLVYFRDCGAFVQKDWVIKGVIAKGETSGWVAPPGSGKSALLTEIGVHCAAGIDWRGNKSKQACGVVIFALERADVCKRRLQAYKVRDKLLDLPIAVYGGIIDLRSPTCVEIIGANVREVEKHLGCSVGVIVLDTLNKGIAAGGGDEDKARDQNQVAANLRRVQELLGVHIALVGHTGKDEKRGARGSNAFLGDVDVMVQIEGTDIRTASVTKGNEQPERVLARFRLEPVVLGFDDDGDKITTAVLAADTVDGPAMSARRDPRLTPNQKTLFAILHDAGRAGLSTDDWSTKAKEAGIGERRRADITDARTALKAKGLVREYADQWHVDHQSD